MPPSLWSPPWFSFNRWVNLFLLGCHCSVYFIVRYYTYIFDHLFPLQPGTSFFFSFCLFYFWPHLMVCGNLVSQPRMKHTPLVLKVQNLNHLASKEVPGTSLRPGRLDLTDFCIPKTQTSLDHSEYSSNSSWIEWSHQLVLASVSVSFTRLGASWRQVWALFIFIYSTWHRTGSR